MNNNLSDFLGVLICYLLAMFIEFRLISSYYKSIDNIYLCTLQEMLILVSLIVLCMLITYNYINYLKKFLAERSKIRKRNERNFKYGRK